MKHRFMTVIAALLLIGCQPGPALTPASHPEVVESVPFQSNPTRSDWEKSLATFHKVDNYPLYIMTYYGDYAFDAYLDMSDGGDDHWACTVFAAQTPDGEALLGRNYDWYTRPVMLLYTDPPDGYAAAAMVDLSYLGFDEHAPTEEQLANLVDAPYWSFDGMNEAGFAIGMMAVPYGESSNAADKPTLSSITTIRYLLDYAADVEEAIELLGGINVAFEIGPPVHYLIADAAGNSAVIEFVGGELVVLRPDQPFQVSTNYVISEVAEEFRLAKCDRYELVTETLAQSTGQITMDDSMTLLSEVASHSISYPTMWSIVFNMNSGDIDIVVGLQYDTVYNFQLAILP